MNAVRENIRRHVREQRRRALRRRRVRLFGATMLGIAIAAGIAGSGLAPADAASGRFIPLKAVEVSDSVLANMRGRYVSPTAIVYFGVEMNTSWQTASNRNYNAGLYVGVNRGNSGIRPTVTILSRASGGNLGGGTPHNAGMGSFGGLGQVQGVVQGIQATGNGNVGGNQMTLTLAKGGSAQPSGTGWQPSGTTYAVGNGGASAGASVHIGQAGVSISIPGQGGATQTLSGLGMQQQIQMSGVGNRVLNQVQITALINQSGLGSHANGIRSALESMRGLSGGGFY